MKTKLRSRNIGKKGQNVTTAFMILVTFGIGIIVAIISLVAGGKITDDIGRASGHVINASGSGTNSQTTTIGNLTDQIGNGYENMSTQFGLVGTIVVLSAIVMILTGFLLRSVSGGVR